MNRIIAFRRWLHRHRSHFLCGVLALLFLIILFLEVLSLGAAKIFNYAMAHQDMLRGTITVERLFSDFTGHVYFTNLTWIDRNGQTILSIPSGNFRVRLWDVITRHYKATTIQELTVNNATVSLHLDDKGHLDFMRPTQDMDDVSDDDDWMNKARFNLLTEEERHALGERRRILRERKMQERWQNFNRGDRRIKMKLHVHNSRFEVFYRSSHYLMSHVELNSVINTEKEMTLNASIGGFGGTMVGDGISVRGNMALGDREEPDIDLGIVFYAVQPSSLGIGMNIKEKMTLATYFTGPLSHPIGSGTLSMDELNIPGLHFEKVQGVFSYHGPTLNVTDIHAKIFGGDFHAYGDYDFDTRYYHIYGKGTNLQAKDALPKSGLNCSVELDLTFSSHGSHEKTYAKGSFSSGPGIYRHFPFQTFSGKVESSFHDLKFSDVKIVFNGFTVTTDGLRIKDKKLTFAPIDIRDYQGGHVYTYVQEERKTSK